MAGEKVKSHDRAAEDDGNAITARSRLCPRHLDRVFAVPRDGLEGVGAGDGATHTPVGADEGDLLLLRL